MLPTLVSTSWLVENLNNPDIAIIDASWHMPASDHKAAEEFQKSRIPHARFFDIDLIALEDTSLPHMLPSPQDFVRHISKLGIRNDQKIICYDTAGLFSAARAWWTFRVFGHEEVAILDGGFPKWRKEDLPIETSPPQIIEPSHFEVTFHPELVHDRLQVLETIRNKSAQIIDARGAARFQGTQQEPRLGVRSGHMPGAYNVPYNKLLQADGTLKPTEELKTIFTEAGVALDRPIVTSCGSGITAAVLLFGLDRLGVKNHALYDGSWSEWGANADLPVETGS